MNWWRVAEAIFAIIGALTVFTVVAAFAIDFVLTLAGFDPG